MTLPEDLVEFVTEERFRGQGPAPSQDDRFKRLNMVRLGLTAAWYEVNDKGVEWAMARADEIAADRRTRKSSSLHEEPSFDVGRYREQDLRAAVAYLLAMDKQQH